MPVYHVSKQRYIAYNTAIADQIDKLDFPPTRELCDVSCDFFIRPLTLSIHDEWDIVHNFKPNKGSFLPLWKSKEISECEYSQHAIFSPGIKHQSDPELT